MEKDRYEIIGLMSGTSLDGLDLLACDFYQEKGRWNYTVKAAETIAYPDEWKARLSRLTQASGKELACSHADLGHYLGRCAAAFVQKNHLHPLLVASHGHTIFHQPERGFTLQIGDGAALATECGLTVVNDFRLTDVALGGQGAPLVPIGDELLFPQYDACLNIGGIANISFRNEGQRVAFDIAPANQVFNYLAALKGLPFDRDGRLARKGKVDAACLEKLNALKYYAQPYPKSLGKEWVDAACLPVLKTSCLSVEDALATAVEHVAFQIARVLNDFHIRSLLLSGGGTWNAFLRERLAAMAAGTQCCIPSEEVVDYKEALIFAFLGLKRWLGEANCLRSVTGASRDCCGGALWLP